MGPSIRQCSDGISRKSSSTSIAGVRQSTPITDVTTISATSDTALEGDYLYDFFGDFVSRGFLVYDWRQEQPLGDGSSVFKGDKFSGWFSNLTIARGLTGRSRLRPYRGQPDPHDTHSPDVFRRRRFDGVPDRLRFKQIHRDDPGISHQQSHYPRPGPGGSTDELDEHARRTRRGSGRRFHHPRRHLRRRAQFQHGHSSSSTRISLPAT